MRGLGVRQTGYLSEDEGLSPIRVETGEQVSDRSGLPSVDHGLLGHPLDETPIARPASNVIGADAPRDGEQPRLNGRLATIRADRPHAAEIGLLGQIVGRVRGTERTTEATHGGTRRLHQGAQRHVISLLCRLEEVPEGVVGGHAAIMPEPPSDWTRPTRSGIRCR